jgi:O-acetyl-ADP-ribose deacetylase (regulator of RNase III)
MIEYKQGNLLDSSAEALVNTVNTVGVMGKGVALQFKEHFTKNYRIYEDACKEGQVKVGKMLLTETGTLTVPKYIINFPTKQHWRGGSKIEFITSGLEDLIRVINEKDIKSIAVPPLGCGNGGLDWTKVKPLIESALGSMSGLKVELYEPGWVNATAKAAQADSKLTKSRASLLSLIYRYAELGFDITHLEIQKLAYFLQSFGQDLRLRYEKGTYGPYAPNLRHLLQTLEGSYLSGDIRVADARPLDTVRPVEKKEDVVMDYIQKNLNEDEMLRLEKVEDLIEGYESPFGLELLSTVFWVVAENNNNTNSDFVITAVQQWNSRKRELMKPVQIEQALLRVKKNIG